jgi:mersacidin/lichenicidin family type 2 lantibiotic
MKSAAVATLSDLPVIPRITEQRMRTRFALHSADAPEEGANMSTETIIRAWKDPKYRDTLGTEERAMIPEHPAGVVELSDAELGTVRGGGLGALIGIFFGGGYAKEGVLSNNCRFFPKTTGPKAKTECKSPKSA